MAGTKAFLAELERRRSNEVASDCEDARNLSMRERGERLVEVCRSAWMILRARPDFKKAAAWQDPKAPDLALRWREWTRDYRKRHGSD